MDQKVATQANVSDERDQFIPIRKSDILDALISSGRLVGLEQHEKFRQLCRLLGAVFHYEYFDQLEKLRDDYYYFNPEIALDSRLDGKAIEQARVQLVQNLEKVLIGAN